jgi:hypoxanthine phosphoribosyltransferase
LNVHPAERRSLCSDARSVLSATDNSPRVLIGEEELRQRVRQLATAITEDHKDKCPILVCVLKGAVVFLADLVRLLPFELEVDFMAVSSYGQSTESSGIVRILKDLDSDVDGRHILVVEDIIDSGLTLQYLTGHLRSRNPATVEVATLLSKPVRRVADIDCRYTGFEISDEFVVGYGLDYMEKYRSLPYIGVIDDLG